jgi:hypothetical protein
MVQIVGDNIHKEINTKNIGDNIMGANYTPTHGLQHRKSTLWVTMCLLDRKYYEFGRFPTNGDSFLTCPT